VDHHHEDASLGTTLPKDPEDKDSRRAVATCRYSRETSAWIQRPCLRLPQLVLVCAHEREWILYLSGNDRLLGSLQNHASRASRRAPFAVPRTAQIVLKDDEPVKLRTILGDESVSSRCAAVQLPQRLRPRARRAPDRKLHTTANHPCMNGPISLTPDGFPGSTVPVAVVG
jgi:hypothetical protein